MEIKRGDIWYVSKDNYTGCEQAAGRPAIIVSNEKNNACAETVEVVYLTTQPKKDLTTHVLIRSSERESTALCEQITTVSVDRLLGYKGHLTPAEMTNVEVAMLISLELEVGKPVEKIVEVTKEVPVIRDVKVSTPASNPNMAAELADFSESEREAAGRLFRMAHDWTVGRGVPDTVQMSRKTFHLWQKLGDFCASI